MDKATEQDFDEIVLFLVENFIIDEPLCVSLNLTVDDFVFEWFQSKLQFTFITTISTLLLYKVNFFFLENFFRY